MTFLWRMFSFFFTGWRNLFMHIALAWRYGFCLSKILSVFPRWFRRSFQYILSFQLLFHKSRFWCFIRSLAWHSFTTTSVPKLIFLFPISADGRRVLFLLWDSSQSFGFYLLPSPVMRFVRATICPCAPLFTHPVTKYKHLLVSILTWICYLRNWPRFLFQRSVLGLLIQIRRNSSNPSLLLSQWETTWQSDSKGPVLRSGDYPLLPVPLWPIVVLPVRVPSMGQIDLFKNYSYLIGIFDIIAACKNLKKQYKKCKL